MGLAHPGMPGRYALDPEDTEPRSASLSGGIQVDEHLLNTYLMPDISREDAAENTGDGDMKQRRPLLPETRGPVGDMRVGVRQTAQTVCQADSAR